MKFIKKPYYGLFAIFLFAIFLRLFYFPENVYFASDQARDAYYSYEVINGNLKVVGPGTTLNKYLHHGVLYYYVMGPVYFFSNGNPYIPALLVSLFNALGVIVVFFIGKILFKEKIGLLAAFLYAISFEQTQYALFFSHPAPAVVTVLLYYLGLSLLFFKGNSKGLPLAIVAAVLSTQLHFSLVILIIFLPIFLILFKSKLPRTTLLDFLLAIIGFLISGATFILAEVKYRQIISFISTFGNEGSSSFSLNIGNFIFALNRYVHDNLVITPNSMWGLLVVIAMFIIFTKQKESKGKIVFLTIWFLIGCVAYLIGSGTTYYFGMGGSVSLLIITAVVVHKLFQKKKAVGVVIVLIIIGSNLYQIITFNKQGPNGEVMAPTGMLLSEELQAIDYIYEQSGKEEFSIHALTIPYNVKTTWDYLFNWYGKSKYGFVPVWGGEDALGSEGTLKVVRARSTLPEKQFLIIEPLTGLADKIVEDFLREEGYFTNLVNEKRFGRIIVQTRKKY